MKPRRIDTSLMRGCFGRRTLYRLLVTGCLLPATVLGPRRSFRISSTWQGHCQGPFVLLGAFAMGGKRQSRCQCRLQKSQGIISRSPAACMQPWHITRSSLTFVMVDPSSSPPRALCCDQKSSSGITCVWARKHTWSTSPGGIPRTPRPLQSSHLRSDPSLRQGGGMLRDSSPRRR